MDVFVARQPIFDQHNVVHGYELLFRAGLENAFPKGMNGDVASSRVISDTMTVFGFDSITAGKIAYINATRRVLMDKLYLALPGRRTVLEVLETVDGDEDAAKACKLAKDAGYILALDDFVDHPRLEPLLPLADIIKVDFMATKAEERSALPQRMARHKCRMLAEKVESREEFGKALADGYTLFQGYFFCRPEIVARKDVPTSKLVHLQFLRELGRVQLDFDRLEQVIKLDVGLSVKLLRYLNSAYFGWRCKVTSLKQAIIMLGERPFRQWASLVAVMAIAADRPSELTSLCLTRARFCELLAEPAGMSEDALDLFLAGLLSSIDALVGRPLSEVVQDLGVSREVEKALVGDRNQTKLGRVVDLVLAYERGAWDDVQAIAKGLVLSEESMSSAYKKALTWVESVMPRTK